MFDVEIEAALKHAQPHQQLRAFVLALVAQGQTQQQVYDVFENFRARLREVAREADEDCVMDVMDEICGWCSPQHRLFDTDLEA